MMDHFRNGFVSRQTLRFLLISLLTKRRYEVEDEVIEEILNNSLMTPQTQKYKMEFSTWGISNSSSKCSNNKQLPVTLYDTQHFISLVVDLLTQLDKEKF
jgi:hypothetical protein